MHFFLILQLCLAPFFTFFHLSDLNIIYSKFLEKSDFFEKNWIFSGKYRIFPIFRRKIRDFSRFFTDFFSSDFFLSKSFPCHPKTDFSPKNRPKNPIFFPCHQLRVRETDIPKTTLGRVMGTMSLR